MEVLWIKFTNCRLEGLGFMLLLMVSQTQMLNQQTDETISYSRKSQMIGTFFFTGYFQSLLISPISKQKVFTRFNQ